MRRISAFPVLTALGATAVAAVVLLLGVASAAPAPAPTSTSTVRTVLGAGMVAAPDGIALDAAGDLFVADTDHCRVLVVPARVTNSYGLHLRPGRVATLAGGNCSGAHPFGHPTGVAVDGRGDVYVAEATAQRVQEVPESGRRSVVTVAGTGTAGFNGDGGLGPSSELDEPTSVAVDAAGDVFIADTANCRVRVLAARDAVFFGQTVQARHVATVAGTGVCGTVGQGGPLVSAQLWDPIAVAVDSGGNLVVADQGDQSVLVAPARTGTYWGTAVGGGDLGVVVGGTGSYQPYLADGLPATGPTAELNDPSGLALGPTDALFVTDGFMHAIRVVPASTGTLLGRSMKAGALYTAAGAVPVSTAAGLGDGTQWLVTHMGTPAGVAVSSSGAVYFSDAGLDTVRVIGGDEGGSTG